MAYANYAGKEDIINNGLVIKKRVLGSVTFRPTQRKRRRKMRILYFLYNSERRSTMEQ